MPVLKRYTEECDHVTEMGVRWVISTWAFLEGNPKTLISYDIEYPEHHGGNLKEVEDAVAETDINFKFIKADVLKIEMEPTDLLFIDTYHCYEQLKQELDLHASKAKKYIVFHDTTTFAYCNEGEPTGSGKGIWPAIQEFLDSHSTEWVLHERLTNNNGLTIIKRL
jgi:cephalosporin hydroxylase